MLITIFSKNSIFEFSTMVASNPHDLANVGTLLYLKSGTQGFEHLKGISLLPYELHPSES